MRDLCEISRTEMEELIFQWVNGRNAERNRHILADRLFNGTTHERLAEAYDLSVAQIKRILYRGMATIMRHT